MDSNNTGNSNGSNTMANLGTPIAILVGLVVIAAAVFFGLKYQPSGQQGTNGNNQQAAANVNIKDVKTDGVPFIGNPNAPVSMALFFDYQCPFCKQFDETVLAQLYTNYVQKGELKVYLKDFDFIGPDSLVASEYGRAVWSLYPDKYQAWLTAMFNAQDEENKGFGDEASIKKLLATIPGVDVNKVSADVTANKAKYDAAVQASFTEGQGYGIQGTPSVIIGTTLLQGAQTYQAVAAVVDAQLKK